MLPPEALSPCAPRRANVLPPREYRSGRDNHQPSGTVARLIRVMRHEACAASPGRSPEWPARHSALEKRVRIESLLAFLVVGVVAGWLAGQIVRGRGFGLLVNLVVGVLGAFIAGWLLPNLGVMRWRPGWQTSFRR